MTKKYLQHLPYPQKVVTILLSFLLLTTVNANEVEIVDVKAHQKNDKTWTFAVTLKHDDKGWDHYANEWQIIGNDNKIFGTRTCITRMLRSNPLLVTYRG